MTRGAEPFGKGGDFCLHGAASFMDLTFCIRLAVGTFWMPEGKTLPIACSYRERETAA